MIYKEMKYEMAKTELINCGNEIIMILTLKVNPVSAGSSRKKCFVLKSTLALNVYDIPQTAVTLIISAQ